MRSFKLCKDQLAEKLAALFRETDPNNIDAAVNQAKNALEQENKQTKRGDLERLFDAQIQTLKDRGTPEQIVEMFINQRSEVIAKASEMSFEDGHVPFLPVIPRTYMTIYSLMPMLQNKGKSGYTYLDPTEITDVVETSNKPYYIFNVEDGTAMLSKSPKDAEKLIKKQSRRGLTDVEVISLGLHTDVLTRHYVDAVGSRYESEWAPSLYLNDDGPGLSWVSLGSASDGWGAASCGS